MKYLYINNKILYQMHLKFWVNEGRKQDKESFLCFGQNGSSETKRWKI